MKCGSKIEDDEPKFAERMVGSGSWFGIYWSSCRFKYENYVSRKVEAPRHRLKKRETGRYHLVRLIRSDLKLNVFGDIFRVPPELQLEYIVATINVKE
jgi:hypothetical protein